MILNKILWKIIVQLLCFQNLMTMLNKIKFEILFLLLIFIKDLKEKSGSF